MFTLVRLVFITALKSHCMRCVRIRVHEFMNTDSNARDGHARYRMYVMASTSRLHVHAMFTRTYLHVCKCSRHARYHMYASAFTLGCGLHAWETNSEIVHLVSTAPDTPFVFHDVVLPPRHHGVGVTRHPDGTFLMFTMGGTNAVCALFVNKHPPV